MMEYETYRELLLCDDMLRDMLEKENLGYIKAFPFEVIPEGANIILYGAGNVGCEFFRQIDSLKDYYKLVLWVDQCPEGKNSCVREPESIKEAVFDYIVVAIENQNIVRDVRSLLLEMGVPASKIINGIRSNEERHYEREKIYLYPIIEYQARRIRNLLEQVYTNSAYPGKECAVCNSRFPAYHHGLTTEFQVCPICSSLSRHRTLWLWIRHNQPWLFQPQSEVSLLHFAPEKCLYEKFKKFEKLEYYPVDYSVNYHLPIREKVDITNIKYEDEKFDCVICSHVLEHIIDDKKAMSELYRVLKPGGVAYILVPWDEERESSFENPDYCTPELREKYFGQCDHVRIYGKDFEIRLKLAGFHTDILYPNLEYTPEERRIYGLYENETIFFCTK